MSDAKELESLRNILEEFRKDPKLQEFYPVITEMLEGIQYPDYDNSKKIIQMTNQIIMKKNLEALAIGAYQNAAMSVPQKKWYEYDEY